MNDTTPYIVAQQLAALPACSMDDLAQRWEALTGHPAPRRNKRALVKRLAYAIQVQAEGGLSAETMTTIEAIYRKYGGVDMPAAPHPGSCLLREWRGTLYRVNILPQGFEYAGAWYASLSAIAREITGTRINGRAFFRAGGRNG